MLDPRVHDPEEYEGKGVVIRGCQYELGRLVGSGGSKFVHLLRNRRSGLTLMVLKVFRDPENARGELARELAAYGLDQMLGFGQVPNLMEVALDGAVAHVQDYHGPYEPAPRAELLRGQEFLKAGRWAEGVAALEVAVQAQPDHTVALNNCAFGLVRLERLAEAIDLMARVIEIEPNYLPYLQSYVEYAAMARRPVEVLDGFVRIRERYPHNHSCDDLAAQVPGWAAVLNNSSIDLARAGRLTEAVALIGQAVAVYTRLARTDPQTYEVELAESLLNLANFQRMAGDPAGALVTLYDATDIAERYRRRDLIEFARDLRQRTLSAGPG